jgi:hypothetical protein
VAGKATASSVATGAETGASTASMGSLASVDATAASVTGLQNASSPKPQQVTASHDREEARATGHRTSVAPGVASESHNWSCYHGSLAPNNGPIDPP